MGKDVVTIPEHLRTQLGQVAREIGRQVYPDGLPPGTKFSVLEDLAGAIGDEIARHFAESQVAGQAQDAPDQGTCPCPQCGGATTKMAPRTRVLLTTRGEVRWQEVRARCPRCRRAFSPSGPGVGTGLDPLQSARATEDGPRRGPG
jgi:hypothetical protein